MLEFSFRIFIAFIVSLYVSTTYGKDTKVVVIPLGDDIDQCPVTYACDVGQAAVSFPSVDEHASHSHQLC